MGDITQLLTEWRSGNRESENKLFELVLPDLRRLAHYLMNRERKGHSLQATELINQIYFRMVAARDRDWQSRQHFFAVAARAMRRYLIDHARGRPAGYVERLDEFRDFLPADSAKLELAVSVDHLLEGLAEVNPEWATLVEIKYFLGLTDEEAADAMGVKLRTMQRMWKDARKWLFERMEPDSARGASA